MSLEGISGVRYLNEIALQLEVYRLAKQEPEQAIKIFSIIEIPQLADGARRAVVKRLSHLPSQFQLCIDLIKEITDKPMQSKVAKRVHDKTHSNELKEMLANRFDFTLASRLMEQRAQQEDERMNSFYKTPCFSTRANLFAAMRTAKYRTKAISTMTVSLLERPYVEFDSKYIPYAIRQARDEVKKTIDGLKTVRDLPAQEVKTFLSGLKRQLRALVAMGMNDEIFTLAKACKQFVINAKGIEKSLQIAAQIMAIPHELERVKTRDLESARAICQLLTIPSRQQKVRDVAYRVPYDVILERAASELSGNPLKDAMLSRMSVCLRRYSECPENEIFFLSFDLELSRRDITEEEREVEVAVQKYFRVIGLPGVRVDCRQ